MASRAYVTTSPASTSRLLRGALGSLQAADYLLELLGAAAHRPHRRFDLAGETGHVRVERVIGEQLAGGTLAGGDPLHDAARVLHDAAGGVHEQRADGGHFADVVADVVDQQGRGLDRLAEAGERLRHLLAEPHELVGDHPERLAPFFDQVRYLHGVGAGQHAAVGDLRRGPGAGADLEEGGAEQPVGQHRRHRVGPHQRMQVLANAHPHLETPARRQRDDDVGHLAGRQAGQAHVGAHLNACDVAEVGHHFEMLGEQLPPVADHEQPDREQQQSADHERTDQRQARRTHHFPPWGCAPNPRQTLAGTP